ncbi:hypothetical protein ATO8_14892 [Roseivivax marinus]|jgi:hypothetical protein|uniref:Uncharacterized protein n=1 Tax=Roseivivax marinus TaxID=1379903 RepID=W4HHU5_9RHOB|nr:hypothetical protein [Roseivivax marinus]ETW11963.1 hypothetical protein ATO8_14892 [Roseivivax marinus]UMA64049.1 hypothetical protein LVO79_13585 [Roseivivax marinus]
MTTRWPIALLALAGLAVITVADFAGGASADIYNQPPILALGSGQASGGAHCAALPSGASR